MMYTYLALHMNNIESQDAVMPNNVDSLIKTAESIIGPIESLIGIIINLLIAITGVCAIRYFHKLKEKKYNATFGYYSRLIVRLYGLKAILEEYKSHIVDRFLPENERKEVEPALNATLKNAFTELISTAEETLQFLKHEEDQMPAAREWPRYYTELLLFLGDCVKLKNDKYYNPRFVNNRSQIDEYINGHEQNIQKMIEFMLKRQERFSQKLYKKEDE